MKKILQLAMLASVLLGLGIVLAPSAAHAQYPVITTGYAPAVTYYRPRPILRPFSYAPAVGLYPTATVVAPTTAYYAPTTT